MGGRRHAREIAMQALYQYALNPVPVEELLLYKWIDEKPEGEIKEFADELIRGTIENIDTIDRFIREKSQNWDIERITKVDRAILRFSIYSLMNIPKIPKKVVINEAIEIAKRYGTEKSFQFVNGVLDGITIETRKNKGRKDPNA